MIGVDESEAECPDAYWDEPSRRCSYPLVSTLEQLQPKDVWSSETIVNRTCAYDDRSFVRSFVRSFTCSFIRSFNRLYLSVIVEGCSIVGIVMPNT